MFSKQGVLPYKFMIMIKTNVILLVVFSPASSGSDNNPIISKLQSLLWLQAEGIFLWKDAKQAGAELGQTQLSFS